MFLNKRQTLSSICSFLCLIGIFHGLTSSVRAQQILNRRATTLADLSGMVWIEGDRFIAVHDAKAAKDEGERFLPRVADLLLPSSLKGVTYRDSRILIKGDVPNDLESVAKIPGRNEVLLVESGDGPDGPPIKRIYKARVRSNGVKVVKTVDWPFDITNVEGSAVACLDGTYVFVFAERADNQPSTELTWVTFDPNTMEFAQKSHSVTYMQPDLKRFNRVIVGIDIDSSGWIYAVSAFDPENAGPPLSNDADNGPYAAGVYLIGSIGLEDDDPQINLLASPATVGLVDGFKVETVAIKEDSEAGAYEIFIGTDDEDYGGVLRRLPPPVIPPTSQD